MQYHRSAAVFAIYKAREDILLCHIRPAPFVSADVLHDIPSALIDQRLMGVFNPNPFRLGTLDTLFVFVGQGGIFEVDGVPEVNLILQYLSYGCG